MLSRLSSLKNRATREGQRGFTLIELLIVVAIIGIIAALLIPNFLDALQKAKQKRTVSDERNVGTALMSKLTDEASAAAAGLRAFEPSSYNGAISDHAGMTSILVTEHDYMDEVPEVDGWKNLYLYTAPDTGEPAWLEDNAFFVCSQAQLGEDGTTAGTPLGTCSGVTADEDRSGAFDPTDYEHDILWADGSFILFPSKATATN